MAKLHACWPPTGPHLCLPLPPPPRHRGAPDKQQCIDSLALGSAGGIGDTATAVLAVARRGGAIELLSPLTGQAIGSIPAVPLEPKAGGSAAQREDAVRIRGLHLLWGGADADGSSLPAVLSVTQGGTARVHAPAPGEAPAWEQRRAWQVPPQVCCTAYDPPSGRLAVGCEGAELRLFDAGSGELAFTFKGGKPNMGGCSRGGCSRGAEEEPDLERWHGRVHTGRAPASHLCSAQAVRVSHHPQPLACLQWGWWTSPGTPRSPSCRPPAAAVAATRRGRPAAACWWARDTTR